MYNIVDESGKCKIAEDFNKNNPSVTLPRGTSPVREAKVTFATKDFLATVCHRGERAEDFKKNNPSVTASRATSLYTKEAKVAFASKNKDLTFLLIKPERTM